MAFRLLSLLKRVPMAFVRDFLAADCCRVLTPGGEVGDKNGGVISRTPSSFLLLQDKVIYLFAIYLFFRAPGEMPLQSQFFQPMAGPSRFLNFMDYFGFYGHIDFFLIRNIRIFTDYFLDLGCLKSVKILKNLYFYRLLQIFRDFYLDRGCLKIRKNPYYGLGKNQ